MSENTSTIGSACEKQITISLNNNVDFFNFFCRSPQDINILSNRRVNGNKKLLTFTNILYKIFMYTIQQ